MTESLASSVEQTGASTEQLARSVQSVAQSGQRISDAAAGAATTATQLERTGQSLAALAKQADETTRRSSRDAEEGGVSVQRAIQGFARVRDSVAQSTLVIRDMGKRTSDISTIVDTINLIAERTNLLSLNASIEAARAGDAGRGFAVVAEEIRNLADRSAKATSDIAAIIKALQDVSQEAVSAANDGLRAIDESNIQAEEGAKGLRKILDSVTDTAKVVVSDHTRGGRTARCGETGRRRHHLDRRAGSRGRHGDRRAGQVGGGSGPGECADPENHP